MSFKRNLFGGIYFSVALIQGFQSLEYWVDFEIRKNLRIPRPMDFLFATTFAVGSGLLWPVSVPVMLVHYNYYVPKEKKRYD
jgi:hypothetical protein